MQSGDNTLVDSVDEWMRRFYNGAPLARALAASPRWAAVTVFLLGFVLLLILNLLNGTVLWSNTKHVAVPFLFSPLDWIHLLFAAPLATWMLGHFYGTVVTAMRLVKNDRFITENIISDALKPWRDRLVRRILFAALPWLLAGLWALLVWSTAPTRWAPPTVSTWFMLHPGTLSFPGYVMELLAVGESLIVFSLLSDTLRFWIFHRDVVARILDLRNNRDPNIAPFASCHPDRAFGFGPLSKPMLRAVGIAILAWLVLVIVFVSALVTHQKKPPAEINSMIWLGLIIGGFAPVVVLGPFRPFIVMLRKERDDRQVELRQIIASKESTQSDIDDASSEWESMAKGHTFIIEPRSAVLELAVAVVTLVAAILTFLLWLAGATTPTG